MTSLSPGLRGFLAVARASVTQVFLSGLTQVALGFLLTPADYGVFAVALGIAALGRAVDDGGVRRAIASSSARVRRSQLDDYFSASLFAGTVVWLALFATAAAFRLLGDDLDPQLPVVLVGLGLLSLVNSHATVASAALQNRKQFAGLSSVAVAAALGRAAVALLAAWRGAGPMTFVFSLYAQSVVEALAASRLLGWLPRRPRWSQLGEVRKIVRSARWLLIGAALGGLSRQIDYLLAGLPLSAAEVGQYYFGYQFCMRVGQILTESIRKVALPLLAQTSGRRVETVSGALALALVGSFVSLTALGSAGRFWMLAVWGERWQQAAAALPAISVAIALVVYLASIESILLANGKDRDFLWLGLQRLCLVGLFLTVLTFSSRADVQSFAWAVVAALALHCVRACWRLEKANVLPRNSTRWTTQATLTAIASSSAGSVLFNPVAERQHDRLFLLAVGCLASTVLATSLLAVLAGASQRGPVGPAMKFLRERSR